MAVILRELLNSQRRLFIPEIVQTSTMDCGPASLASLLNGFGINASYGRLREACHTSVDGTSIDALEELAVQLGLEAEQVMLPQEHILFPEAHALPAIAVVRTALDCAHFVVLWRYQHGLVQVMDPAIGRRWMTPRSLEQWLYLHALPVQESQWREWAASEESIGCLRRSLANIKAPVDLSRRLIDMALDDQTWRAVAGLQACVRMMSSVSASRELRARRKPEVIGALFEQILQSDLSWDHTLAQQSWPTIPARYWSVLPGPPAVDGTSQLVLRGAVLVRARALKKNSHSQPAASELNGSPEPSRTSHDAAAMVEESPKRPLREVVRLMRADGLLDAAIVAKGMLLGSGVVLMQAILFRSLLDIGRDLNLPQQRLAAMGLLLVFLLAGLVLNIPVSAGVLRIGRRLEARLRLAIFRKLPNLDDGYLKSRLVSDMAERSHSVDLLRQLPFLGTQLLGSTFQLIMTVAGIIWLAPRSAPIAVLSAAVAIGLPLLFRPLLAERDLRVRTHVGALSRFYLDAMLGLVPIRAHAAELAVRRNHEGLLLEWGRAGLGLQRLVVGLSTLQFLVGLGLAIWLIASHLTAPNHAGSLLLLIFWALSIPGLGGGIASAICGYVTYRNVILRLLEPLSAPESHSAQTALTATGAEVAERAAGVNIEMVDAGLAISGHTILRGVNLAVEAGSHVAIVGPSGAGKSSLVGLLLGWSQPCAGSILIDGRPLDVDLVRRLREETAWVEPGVQLWNRSLEDNLRYGSDTFNLASFGKVIETAELRELLESLPDGLQTALGESGALVSGGEGQRVRLARAMLQGEARLVLLDEPFAALDRERREKLIARMRQLWRGATLLYVTHNIGEALAFDRVLVVENGQIVEDGTPDDLMVREDSRYRALYESDVAVRARFMSSEFWRRLELRRGRLIERNGRKLLSDKGRPRLARDNERWLTDGTGASS